MQSILCSRRLSTALSAGVLVCTGITSPAQDTKPAAQPPAQPSGATAAAPAAPTLAQPSATAAQTISSTEEWIQKSKNPVPWLKWGADLRLRNEYLNNAQSLGNPADKLAEQDYFRFRGRLWAGITPFTNLTFNARLTSEPRDWMRAASYTPFKGHVGPDWTEGVIDNLNVQWNESFGLPTKLTVGRQDLMLGEGWLFGDGSPYDGSWTYFLDAARLTYDLKDQHTTIDVIGIVQNARDNAWLPTINAQNRYMSEQNEKGAVLYVSNKSIPEASLDGYFVYKHDDRIGTYGPLFGDNADIYTVGGRVYGLVATHWKYSVEGAYQAGDKQDSMFGPAAPYKDLSAFGVNTKLNYLFKDSMNNQLGFNYEYLSGDDPTTGKDEMFDLLWGRYPRWSELYNIYSYAAESRVGQTANLHRIGPSWTITPYKNLDFVANYNILLADQAVPTRATAPYHVPGSFSGTGTFRGQYVQTVLKYKFNNHVAGHLWSEFVFPGDFYTHSDVMSFLRAEINLTY